MIEVFKTNVIEPQQADLLITKIQRAFANYRANFDLQDCDRILRIRSLQGDVQPSLLVNLLKEAGFIAEVLPNIPSPVKLVTANAGRRSFTC